MIQNISIEKLVPHPSNPRKDLGDLTELAASIKETGILQNLTVVPYFNDEYKIIIGHRRAAAAKLAGLKEVPCAIVEMDPKTQMATMLLENMQRSDLTVFEQAQGIQMCLDLGETIADIAKKTGFSDTTVRRRAKLLKLDQGKFKAAEKRGGRLMDYIELEKIEDPEEKNNVLDKIGTNNFQWALNNALNKQKSKKNSEIIINELSSFAKETEDVTDCVYVKAYYLDTASFEHVDIPEDADKIKYFYVVKNYGILLYKENNAEIEDDPERLQREEKRRIKAERIKSINTIAKQAYEMRLEFSKNLTDNRVKYFVSKFAPITLEACMYSYISCSQSILGYLFEIEEDDEEGSNLKEAIKEQPDKALYALTYSLLDSENNSYCNYKGEHEENEELDLVYELLELFGYEMSDEEKELKDGTHELYYEEER